ncbi:MAG: tRNA (N6-threonylcarbamoyladenosine(37)-N6)-methyltransferase TrmO [Candidatus Omnitrophota bacterium]|nr:tRNA (N6-threonylcarbamoyladenosine(37)-N6)-methyltransferase TrmO [Candidatus Omnitrophota bacterium]MBU1928782.1 tRNA (N6-threonylcarbamoyladenosine(37)-N6)-methyltransferase TrmO [Candidatus Omnitrophota bacterium]MBU2034241.1 tRNA (N6-threonylcarbamoyladenosine(37)-N6)-methyltransferase TrmO [Candidatus Omnitrophota bacterium]
MEEQIKLKPIGTIYTPYKEPDGIPIQGRFEKNVIGRIDLLPEYRSGLKDIGGFSHLILLYYFNCSKEEKLVGKPFLEGRKHGIFAIRSPHRPNHIGFSIVKLIKIRGNNIFFSEVDMIDGTPLLDIKPYVSHFDSRRRVKNGWIDEYFTNRKVPGRVRVQ